jgi:gliding motility-associated-like protein
MMLKRGLLLLLLILISSLVFAQCTSTTGTAIISETFGAGTSTIGPQLPAGVTNLQYLTTTCPNDGQYSIVNFSTGCYNSWHTVKDHTGDANGYYMVINASIQPSDFYVKTITGLCDGTTYQFSSWILNIDAFESPSLPNITFTIETPGGIVLKRYDSGTIHYTPTPTWKQYDTSFITPAGVSTVVIRMHNNANGGVGNDLALDDISFTPAGPPTSIGITGVTGNTATTGCNKTTSLYSTVGTCYVNTTYQWQRSADNNSWTDIPGANNATYDIISANAGKYFYRLSVAENGSIGSLTCRVNSNVVTVDDNYIAPVTSNVSAAVCFGSSYNLPSGKTVSASGIYLDTIRRKTGCDSIITNVTLTVKPLASSTISAVINYGETYLGHNQKGTYTDVLTASNGCDSLRTLTLSIKTVYSTISATICAGQNYDGYIASGTYVDTLIVASSYDSVRTLNLTAYSRLNPDLGPDKTLCLGDSTTLYPGAFMQYLWQDRSAAPQYKVLKSGTYWVKVTDANGCEATDSIVIKSGNCLAPKISNTFTPNGDGINDTWNIDDLQNFPQCTVFVYSRWGQELFKSIGYTKPWDGRYNGTYLQPGTYYYVIKLDSNSPAISGYITLIR